MPEGLSSLAGQGMTVMNYLTVTQVAERLGITSERVRVLIRGGRLPAQKFGPVYMVREGDVKLVAVRKTGRPPFKKRRKAA